MKSKKVGTFVYSGPERYGFDAWTCETLKKEKLVSSIQNLSIEELISINWVCLLSFASGRLSTTHASQLRNDCIHRLIDREMYTCHCLACNIIL